MRKLRNILLKSAVCSTLILGATAPIITSCGPSIGKCTITFDAGNKGRITTGTSTIEVDNGTEFSSINTPFVTANNGYRFKGWDFNGKVTSNMTVKAKYENFQEVKTCKVTFDLNGGEKLYGDLQNNVAQGAKLENINKPSILAPDGYVFVRWELETSNSNTINSDTKVKAIFRDKKQDEKITHNLEFVVDGDEKITKGDSSLTIDDETTWASVKELSNFPVLSKLDNKLDFYFIPGSSIKTSKILDKDYNFSWLGRSASITINASWKPENALYYVTFSREDDTEVAMVGSQSIAIDKVSTFGSVQKPIATKEGFVFEGWKDIYTGETISDDFEIKDDLFVEPIFEINKYYVYLMLNDGKYDTNKLEVEYGSRLTDVLQNVIPTKNGYTFIKWLKEGDEEIAADDLVTKDMAVLAKYDANQYTVTFSVDSKYGTIDPSKQTVDVPYNFEIDKIAKPEVQPKPGWAFTGWQYTGTTVTSDMALVASFEETTTTYTVKFKEGLAEAIEGQQEYTLQTGYPYSHVKEPTVTKNGYKCVGWVDENNNQMYSDSTITSDVELTPIFVKNMDGTEEYVNAFVNKATELSLVTEGTPYSEDAKLEYSVDNGTNWSSLTSEGVQIPEDSNVLLRGEIRSSSSGTHTIYFNGGVVTLSGKLINLIDHDEQSDSIELYAYQCKQLFDGVSRNQCLYYVDPSFLEGISKAGENSLKELFDNCNKLHVVPNFTIPTVESNAYRMSCRDTAIETMPKINFEAVSNSSVCGDMFQITNGPNCHLRQLRVPPCGMTKSSAQYQRMFCYNRNAKFSLTRTNDYPNYYFSVGEDAGMFVDMFQYSSGTFTGSPANGDIIWTNLEVLPD